MADYAQIKLVVSALTFSTSFYILSKFESHENVVEKLRKFKVLTEISDLTDKILKMGLNSGFSDFEDALQYYCALNSNCTIFFTRNVKDFKKTDIKVMTPTDFLNNQKDFL